MKLHQTRIEGREESMSPSGGEAWGQKALSRRNLSTMGESVRYKLHPKENLHASGSALTATNGE